MSQADSANTTNPSRRLFLAAGSVASVFGALARAVGDAHQGQSIFDLIAAHRSAFAAFTEACEREDVLSDDKESAAYKQAAADWHRLGEAESDALTALLAHRAADLDEARMKAQYVLDTQDFEAITHDKLDALLCSFL